MKTTTNTVEMGNKRKRRGRRGKKSLMSRVIWIDLPVNIVIVAWAAMKLLGMFADGADKGLEKISMLFMDPVGADYVLVYVVPVIVVLAVFGIIYNITYLISRARGKEVFISENYEVAFIVLKVFALICILAAVIVAPMFGY